MLKLFIKYFIGILTCIIFSSAVAQQNQDFTFTLNKYSQKKNIQAILEEAETKGVQLSISEIVTNERRQITGIKIVIANSESMDYYQSDTPAAIPAINIGQRGNVVFIDHKGQDEKTQPISKRQENNMLINGRRTDGMNYNRKGSYANTKNKFRVATISDLMKDPKSPKKLVIINGQQSTLQELIAFYRKGIKFEIDILQPNNALILFGGNERSLNGAILAASINE